jgi:hypothetical protein
MTQVAAALIAAALAAGAAPPGKIDYNKLAGEAKGPARLGEAILLLNKDAGGYKLQILPSGGAREWGFTLWKGKQALYSWASDSPLGFVRDGVVYHPVYHKGINGCDVVAFDLKAGKQRWRTELKGIGRFPHRLYRNEVTFAPFDERTLIVFGKESRGSYVEIVDLKTGKTVGHRSDRVPVRVPLELYGESFADR